MSDVIWEIDKIINNPKTQVRIKFYDSFDPSVDHVLGFMIDETFPIGGSANYTAISDQSLLESLGVPNIVSTIADVAGMGKKALLQTVKKWEGSEMPPFSVGLLFIARKPTDHIEKYAAILASKCFAKISGQLFHAPMGYNPFESGQEAVYQEGKQDLTGTCVLSIGEWFEAYGLLLMSADFEASKECIGNGSPLYITGKVTFSPYREISYTEFLKYFKLAGL